MESKFNKRRRLRATGRLGGLIGGPARAILLTPERRREIALLGAEARWGAPQVGTVAGGSTAK